MRYLLKDPDNRVRACKHTAGFVEGGKENTALDSKGDGEKFNLFLCVRYLKKHRESR